MIDDFILFKGEHIIFDFEGFPVYSSLTGLRQKELGRDLSERLLFYGNTFNLSDMSRVWLGEDRFKSSNSKLTKEK